VGDMSPLRGTETEEIKRNMCSCVEWNKVFDTLRRK
jgi:hypothetical protein